MKLYVRANKYTQVKVIIPEYLESEFSDLLDRIGTWYTTEQVENGVEFIYGIYIGSRDAKKIEKYLDSKL